MNKELIFLLNYYTKNNNTFADNLISPYLKQLTLIDNTGWGGSITNQDYTDWVHSFIQNDSFSLNKKNHSHLKDFVNDNPNFKSIYIRTQRGFWSGAMDDYPLPCKYVYSDTWEIWKNS